MRLRVLLTGAMALVIAIAAAGCGGGSSSETPAVDDTTPAATGTAGETTGETSEEAGGEIVKGGILRVGSINYIDSLNPFNYIESQAYNAFIMIYPQIVQYVALLAAEVGDGVIVDLDAATNPAVGVVYLRQSRDRTGAADAFERGV